uniref:Ig-like domain-containing protein n=1 Tax=Sinocyclocheilus anshuiensis TaxID=1608454 RepID=A0A671QML7_9TELE
MHSNLHSKPHKVLLFHQTRIYGEEVEMKVRPGDNITLYCDRSLTYGSLIVWIRNCSHENQPSLIIDFTKWELKIFQRFSSIYNRYSNSYDLHITNISVSDLGLYYCAELENKVNKDEKGIISISNVYYYGNRTTRLSMEVCVRCVFSSLHSCPLSVFSASVRLKLQVTHFLDTIFPI